MPFAVAAGLLALSLGQTVAIMHLLAAGQETAGQLQKARSELGVLRQSAALASLRLTSLAARDPAYAAARVFVAWDAGTHRGSIAMENLSPAPAGQHYQLWILDPNAPGPLSAGVVTGNRAFEAGSVSMPSPGFAISLETADGNAAPTGPILFAVAPAR